MISALQVRHSLTGSPAEKFFTHSVCLGIIEV